MNIFETIKKSLSLDDRSLAFYRFLMGLIVMADVTYRLEDLTNFYTDVGLVPRAQFISEMGVPWSFSFHLANGSFGFAVMMFSLHFLFGLMLMIGYKTRWVTIGAFVMTVSVHNRNWLVNNGGDDILRAVLFLSIFLPLNRCFSIDSALTDKKNAPPLHHNFFSFWSLTFFLQVFVIYFVSYILKDHPMWRTNFDAVYYASRLDIFATPIGFWLRNFPFFQKLTTIYTIGLEWLGSLLLILAFLFGKRWWIVRLAVVGLFLILHMGIILTMWIGVFPYLCLVVWMIFIPGPFWDLLERSFKAKSLDKLSIYFDGECRFCEKGVLILRELFLLPQVKISRTQDVSEIETLMIQENSWVIVNKNGDRFFHFGGMLEVMRHSPLLKFFVPFFSQKIVFDLFQNLYKWMAKNRKIFSQYSQFFELKSPKKKIPALSWLFEISGAFMFLTLLMWNIGTIKRWNIQAPFFQNVTRWLHLYQEWNMFAPFPKMDNVWIEIPATLSDGSELELISGERDIYSIKDKKFYQAVPNEHWRKFYLNLSDSTTNARYYGGFLCRQWNERGIRKVPDTTLRKMEIIVYSQLNLPKNERGGISRKLSWKHWCFDEDYKLDNNGKDPRTPL